MNELINFFVKQGYSPEEAEALSIELMKRNSAQLKQAAPEWEYNPYVISAEQKKRQDKFEEDKNRQADVLTFGMTPHKNQAAANAGAEEIASNILWPILLEGANQFMLQPVLRLIGHTNLGRSIMLSHQLNKVQPALNQEGAMVTNSNIAQSMKRIPQRLIVDYTMPMKNSPLMNRFNDNNFTPLVRMSLGNAHKYYAEEIIKRLEEMGYNVNELTPITVRGETRLITPAKFIREQAKNLIYGGYYGSPEATTDIAGTFLDDLNTAIFDIRGRDSFYTVLHEAIMHGTDNVIDSFARIIDKGKFLDQAKKMYTDFIDNITSGTAVTNSKLTLPDGKIMITFPNGKAQVITKGALSWRELRATIGELTMKYVYAFKEASGMDLYDPGFREAFRKYMDTVPEESIIKELENISSYGRSYAKFQEHYPNLVTDIKNLIKYAPSVAIPVVTFNAQNDENN